MRSLAEPLRHRTSAGRVSQELGGSGRCVLCIHSAKWLVPPEKYFKTHPEYYALVKGKRTPSQLCLTNPEVVKIATNTVLQALKECPDCTSVGVSQNDNPEYCQCDKCRALDEAEGSHAGSLIHFVNQVAAAVEREYPDVTVNTMAYMYTVKPPRIVCPCRNVIIQLATDRAMWPHPFTPAAKSEEFSTTLEGWAQIHARIHIWDYCANFCHYLAPWPNMGAIADNIRYFTAHNVEGIMEEGDYQSPGSERAPMRCWVLANLMWNPSLDVRQLMQDFIWGYYGKAAPAIAAYNELLWQTTSGAPSDSEEHRKSIEMTLRSREFVDEATVLFDRAEKLAENEEILHRVELARLSIMYVKLMRGPEFVTKLGEDYPALIDRFATIARRENITHLSEGKPDLDIKLKRWRDDWWPMMSWLR